MPTTSEKGLRKRMLYYLIKCLPQRFKLSDLETIKTADLIDFGEMSVIPSFQKAARMLPFYKKLLQEKGVDTTRIQTLEAFSLFVPIIRKNDIFPVFSASDICQNGKVDDIRSAIVTSGTSGVFAYGLLTNEDISFQRKMIDEFFDYYFNAKNEPILIINALAMGVSFVSQYPVISTSVRPDIVIHLIKTFHAFYKRIVIICDPNFAKKIVDDGDSASVSWKDIPVSFVVGGSWFSNSLAQYLLARINNDTKKSTNAILGTMGLTEIALNIFSAPDELIAIRNILQDDKKLLAEIFGTDTTVCPEMMYYYPTRTYIEIPETDSRNRGNIVISHLDTKSKTPLFRYDTTDKGMFIDRNHLEDALKTNGYDIPLKLHLPLIAIFERNNDALADDFSVSVSEIKEALFQTPEIVPFLTGHFIILQEKHTVEIQLEKNAQKTDSIRIALETNIKNVSNKQVAVVLIPYHSFTRDLDLNFERKWKHTS